MAVFVLIFNEQLSLSRYNLIAQLVFDQLDQLSKHLTQVLTFCQGERPLTRLECMNISQL